MGEKHGPSHSLGGFVSFFHYGRLAAAAYSRACTKLICSKGRPVELFAPGVSLLRHVLKFRNLTS